MASFDWGAFVAGAADTTLKSWESREASDRKMKEAEMLEKLRRETSDYEFTRDNEHNRKKVKGTRFDPLTGESIDVNDMGEEIGRRKDQAALDAYKQDQEKFQLDQANTRSQIQSRTDSTALERARIGESRADRAQRAAEFNASGGGTGSGDGFVTGTASVDLGRKLFGANKIVVDDAIRAGIPAEVLDRLSVESAARVKERNGSPAEAQRLFLDGISELRRGSSGVGDQKTWSLDAMQQSRKTK